MVYNKEKPMRKIYYALLMIVMVSCKDEQKELYKITEKKTVDHTKISNTKKDAEFAKNWLEENINSFFNENTSSITHDMRSITTTDYYDYKMDAMNVGMDMTGSLSKEEFKNKWKNKFDTSKAGIGVGFLISGQDWDSIKVTKCDLIDEKDNAFLFDVIILDKGFKTHYSNKIKVVKNDNQFLIADVLQEN